MRNVTNTNHLFWVNIPRLYTKPLCLSCRRTAIKSNRLGPKCKKSTTLPKISSGSSSSISSSESSSSSTMSSDSCRFNSGLAAKKCYIYFMYINQLSNAFFCTTGISCRYICDKTGHWLMSKIIINKQNSIISIYFISYQC